jgi:DNA-directed RNA polymerase subunit beta
VDLSQQTIVNDAETTGDLTIREDLEDEIPEAAEVGFDDMGIDG